MYILFINSVGCILFITKLEYYFMYILFTNLGGKCDIFIFFIFLLNLITIVIKKKNCPTHGFNPTQPDPHGLGWVGLNLCDGLGWVEFF